MPSNADVYDVRIRFAGLCMFVPIGEPGSKEVHVLLPDARSDEHAHEAVLYWRGGPSRPLSGTLLLGEWEGEDPTMPAGLFHAKDYPVRACPDGLAGKVRRDAEPLALIRFKRGEGKVINYGGKWSMTAAPDTSHSIPTVVDWWINDVNGSELADDLRNWIQAEPDLKTLSGKYAERPNPVVDLWVLHVPGTQQHPGNISSVPQVSSTKPDLHFHLYSALLECGQLEGDAVFKGFDPPNEDDPPWPQAAEEDPIFGMFVDCGITQADPAT